MNCRYFLRIKYNTTLHVIRNNGKKVKYIKFHSFLFFLFLALLPVFYSCSNPDTPDLYSINNVIQFILELQESQPTGLIPITEGSVYTTTYSNAMAAIALLCRDNINEASRILDVFAVQTDSSPLPELTGGFQQHRDASTGGPIDAGVNDFWIGDNAWLLIALNNYKAVTQSNTYDALAQRLVDWIRRIWEITPGDGIYGGFDKNGNFIGKHAEGSIDVYGALRGYDAEDIRQSIKIWLDVNVWIPEGDSFARGPENINNLPTDHVSWGYTSLGIDNSNYITIIPYCKNLNARTFDPFLIDAYDIEPISYWFTDQSDPAVTVTISWEDNGIGNNMAIAYSMDSDHWFRLYRNRDIDLAVSNNFRYSFLLKGDGSNCRFEVKLQDNSNAVYYYPFDMNFTEWQVIDIAYNQFIDFNNPESLPLADITMIEFAVNNSSGSPVTESIIKIGNIRYQDTTAAYTVPVKGFAAFESELNRIFVEGTCQMISAFSTAGMDGDWCYYLDEVHNLLLPSGSGVGMGVPGSLFAGINNPKPESVASSWYVIGAIGLNPFQSEGTSKDE